MPHIHTLEGQFDFTVSGYLVHNSRILLIKHKYLPLWTPPAGHVELNQTPLDALYAEIAEEAGIESSRLQLIETTPYPGSRQRSDIASGLPLPFDMEYHTISETHRHINMAYMLLSNTDTVAPEAGESNTFKWFSAEELHDFKDTNESIISSALYALQYVEEKEYERL